MSVLGDLKSFCQRYLTGGAYYFPCQKRLCKIKYAFEGSISNVDLELFNLNNQLGFSFVKFWFCQIT